MRMYWKWAREGSEWDFTEKVLWLLVIENPRRSLLPVLELTYEAHLYLKPLWGTLEMTSQHSFCVLYGGVPLYPEPLPREWESHKKI